MPTGVVRANSTFWLDFEGLCFARRACTRLATDIRLGLLVFSNDISPLLVTCSDLVCCPASERNSVNLDDLGQFAPVTDDTVEPTIPAPEGVVLT